MVEVKMVACDLTHPINPVTLRIRKGVCRKYTNGYDTPSIFTVTKQLIF